LGMLARAVPLTGAVMCPRCGLRGDGRG
jgi:hypothetical protein